MAEPLWVFGYGSLMWRPGFDYVESLPARLLGAHRSLCVYSFVHRGTRERPGLVLGLDIGGSCRGVAFRVRPGKEDATRDYLKAREQVTAVYREALRPIRICRDGVRQVPALCFVVDREHEQYAGVLPVEEQARIVQGARGASGENVPYILNTVRHLAETGVHDQNLVRVAGLLQARPGDAGTDEDYEAS